jgi:aconitate hydratase
MFHGKNQPEATYSKVLDLDLGSVVPSVAGPKRPQDRVALPEVGRSFAEALPSLKPAKAAASANGHGKSLHNGSVVIAAITSCTNTSNPGVMIAAGILARKAVEKGLETPAWVKTSLAPGSKVVTEYYKAAGLLPYLEKLKFNVVGYGCTTCIGNSGPLPAEISDEIGEHGLVVASVLSGNRNFEGRINSEVRANYLMSPPLVVALALAGRIDFDPVNEPIGKGKDGKPVYLRDIWPSEKEVADTIAKAVQADQYKKTYSEVFEGDARWRGLQVPSGNTFAWDQNSTYIKKAPYFDGMSMQTKPVSDITGARVLAKLGHSITTDHISPAGSIKSDSPAGKYLIGHGVQPRDFNSYGSRRGNHEVMVRGTFANTRIRNKMVPNREGGYTRHLPSNEEMSIFDAAMKYQSEGVPLIVLAGKEYGSGSSRDWAAKGPALQGVRAVIAESFERIHRSNLVGMGILPLQYHEGEDADSLGLTGEELFNITGLAQVLDNYKPASILKVRVQKPDGNSFELKTTLRIDTPQEVLYYKHGGILQFVLRQLLSAKKPAAAN